MVKNSELKLTSGCGCGCGGNAGGCGCGCGCGCDGDCGCGDISAASSAEEQIIELEQAKRSIDERPVELRG